MANPYTDVTVLNYNDDAPSDDGTAVPSNQVKWATVKDEVGDPLKTAIESVNTNVDAAFAKVVGGAGVTSTTAPYTVQNTDQSKLVNITSAGTLTTATAATVTAPFVHAIRNASSGTLTVEGAASETVDGETNITLPAGAGVFLFTDGTNWLTAGRGNVQGVSSFVQTLPRGHIGGLQTSNGTDSDHDIDIAVGAARDNADSFNLEVTSVLTKQIDASWASGTAAGGMASGVSLSPDTWYHLHLVDLDAGGTDAGFDTSVTAANLLATTDVGTKYRRIGSVLTDGSSNITAFLQRGDEFVWVTPILDVNVGSSGTTEFTSTLSVPLGVRVKAFINAVGTNLLYFHDPDVTDQAPSQTVNPLATIGDATQSSIGGAFGVWTNTSSQIQGRSSADSSLRIAALGWRDSLGRWD